MRTAVPQRIVEQSADRQIADELYISKKTASVHVSNILRKLDAANRVEAAEIGQRAGLN
jgi:DNA-binding NarL/FixJ family response regulator